jgi:hypothetical protein
MAGDREPDNYTDEEVALIVFEARSGASLDALHCPRDHAELRVPSQQFRGYERGDEIQGVAHGQGQEVILVSVECPTCGAGRAEVSLLPEKPHRGTLIERLRARGLRQLDAEDVADHVIEQWQPGSGAWVVNGDGGRCQVVRRRTVILDTPSQISAGHLADLLNEMNA